MSDWEVMDRSFEEQVKAKIKERLEEMIDQAFLEVHQSRLHCTTQRPRQDDDGFGHDFDWYDLKMRN